MPTKEEQLIEWFKATFAARTPPKSILDADPRYRVNWHETYAKMKELGWTDTVVELRLEFDRLCKEHHIKKWVNKLLRANDERPW